MEILTLPVSPFGTNCYVLRNESEAVVIDPGEATQQLCDSLEGYTVTHIINTHGHCDHAGGNEIIKEKTGAPIYLHKDDIPMLEALEEQGMMFGCPFPPSPPPDAFMEEGDTLTLCGTPFSVLHTPGHTPGHVILVSETMAFVGDVIFSGSIGRSDLPGGNGAQLMDSIRNKVITLPDETVLYSGHGPATTVGREKAYNPFIR